MKMSGAAQRLIIYIGESDEWEGEPLSRWSRNFVRWGSRA